MTIAAGISLPELELAGTCRRHSVKELAVLGSAARGEILAEAKTIYAA